MKKKVALLLALCVGAAAFAGCSSVWPSTPGIPVVNHEGATVARSWKENLKGMGKFAGKNFMNYDYDDPYEGASVLRSWMKDIGGMQKFTDKYFLNYDYDDPYNE